MKYISYEADNGKSYGLLVNGRVYSMRGLLPEAPGTLLEYIESGASVNPDDIDLLNAPSVPLDRVKLLPPIVNPKREIICLGKNYYDHVNEVKGTSLPNAGVPKHPVYFGKSAASIIGSGDTIPLHSRVTRQVDYEAELTVIIGSECRFVAEEDAYLHVFGYTVLNDVTARDLQTKHGQWYIGKSLAGFCPMGPVVADRAEIPDPMRLKIASRVNGEPRQNSNTCEMIFTIPYVISELSRYFTLMPGDVIATGTPAGVGHGFDPPNNLTEGDVVECEIEGVGTLTNTVGKNDE